MINTLFFGINLLLSVIIWKYIFKPSILDHFRDQLFDLREETRDFYLKNNVPLNDDTYIYLRDLLNSHLRFTENISLAKIFYFSNKIKKSKELESSLIDELKSKLKSTDEKICDFAKDTRNKAVNILLIYLIFSSQLLTFLFILIFLFSIPVFLFNRIMNSIKDEKNFFSKTIKSTSSIVEKYIASENDIEEFSIKSSFNTKLLAT